MKDKYIKNKNRAAARAIKALIDSKQADIVELENALANYGVESFRNHKDTFDPRVQKCIERTPCYEKEMHGLIAQRLLPGYKRYEKILRQEFVTVFTLSEVN
jgi:molecular chaperone GrpE (heat shock protein)